MKDVSEPEPEVRRGGEETEHVVHFGPTVSVRWPMRRECGVSGSAAAVVRSKP